MSLNTSSGKLLQERDWTRIQHNQTLEKSKNQEYMSSSRRRVFFRFQRFSRPTLAEVDFRLPTRCREPGVRRQLLHRRRRRVYASCVTPSCLQTVSLSTTTICPSNGLPLHISLNYIYVKG